MRRCRLTEVGVYSYYAEDPATGRVEYEYDHVLLGDLPADRRLLPDPDEVADACAGSPPTSCAHGLTADARVVRAVAGRRDRPPGRRTSRRPIDARTPLRRRTGAVGWPMRP